MAVSIGAVLAPVQVPRVAAAPLRPVNVRVCDRANTNVRVLETLEREATSIWARYDVGLSWDHDDSAVPIVFLIIERRAHPQGGPLHVLGSTEVRDGEIAPIVHLWQPAAVAFVDALAGQERPLRQWPASAQADVVGRVLGRVVAHEIGHVLLQTMDHTHGGLLKADLLSSEALAWNADWMWLDARQQMVLAHSTQRGYAAASRRTPSCNSRP